MRIFGFFISALAMAILQKEKALIFTDSKTYTIIFIRNFGKTLGKSFSKCRFYTPQEIFLGMALIFNALLAHWIVHASETLDHWSPTKTFFSLPLLLPSRYSDSSFTNNCIITLRHKKKINEIWSIHVTCGKNSVKRPCKQLLFLIQSDHISKRRFLGIFTLD